MNVDPDAFCLAVDMFFVINVLSKCLYGIVVHVPFVENHSQRKILFLYIHNYFIYLLQTFPKFRIKDITYCNIYNCILRIKNAQVARNPGNLQVIQARTRDMQELGIWEKIFFLLSPMRPQII